MASDLTTGVFFYLRVLDEKPLALFRLDVDTDRKEINETVWDGSSWQETNRLTMYIGYGSTEVEQVLERDATLVFPDAFREKAPNFQRIIPTVMSKHLAGKHDQASHAGGHGHGRDLTEVANKVNEKTALINANGEVFRAGQTEDEAEELELAQESVRLIIAQGAPNDDGMEMTMNALDKAGDPVVEDVFIAVEGTGMVAGAVAVSRGEAFGIDISGGDDVDMDNMDDFVVEIPKMMTMNYLGTTGLADGAGSALFGKVVKRAALEERGLILEPLNKKAKTFWEAMGFSDTIKVGTKTVLTETGLVMDAQAVSDLAGLLT
jgi:hypothetical protein